MRYVMRVEKKKIKIGTKKVNHHFAHFHPTCPYLSNPLPSCRTLSPCKSSTSLPSFRIQYSLPSLHV